MGKKLEFGPSKIKLTQQQEKFCRLFTSDEEYLGNGYQSFLHAFNRSPTSKNKNFHMTVAKQASNLLKLPHITARINELLSLAGFNDGNADKQLLFVMNQHWELGTKVAAIREYNKLKKRVEPEGVKGTFINVNINFDIEDKTL